MELKNFTEYLETNANFLLQYYIDKKINTSNIVSMINEIKSADCADRLNAIAEKLDYTIKISESDYGYKHKK